MVTKPSNFSNPDEGSEELGSPILTTIRGMKKIRDETKDSHLRTVLTIQLALVEAFDTCVPALQADKAIMSDAIHAVSKGCAFAIFNIVQTMWPDNPNLPATLGDATGLLIQEMQRAIEFDASNESKTIQ